MQYCWLLRWWMKIKMALSLFWQLSDHEKSGSMWQVARYRTQIVCHRDLFCANSMLSYRRQIKTTHNIKRPIKTWRVWYKYNNLQQVCHCHCPLSECLDMVPGDMGPGWHWTLDLGDTTVRWPCTSVCCLESENHVCWIGAVFWKVLGKQDAYS